MSNNDIGQYLKDAQKFLKSQGLPQIPEQYCELLKKMNGYSSAALRLFGIGPEIIKLQNYDIALYNSALEMKYKETALVLGYTPFDWIIFEDKEKTYNLVDKTDRTIISSYETLGDLLKYLKFYKVD